MIATHARYVILKLTVVKGSDVRCGIQGHCGDAGSVCGGSPKCQIQRLKYRVRFVYPPPVVFRSLSQFFLCIDFFNLVSLDTPAQ